MCQAARQLGIREVPTAAVPAVAVATMAVAVVPVASLAPAAAAPPLLPGSQAVRAVAMRGRAVSPAGAVGREARIRGVGAVHGIAGRTPGLHTPPPPHATVVVFT